jgi:hypothetical protein
MNTYKFRQNLSTSGERVRETRFFEQVKAKIPRQREPAGVSGIAAGGGLQRLFGPALLQHQGVRGVALSISRQRFKSS